MRTKHKKRIMDFKETLLFLQEYSWIFNFKVTCILEDDILSRIPELWFNFLSSSSLEEFNSVLMKVKDEGDEKEEEEEEEEEKEDGEHSSIPDFIKAFKLKVSQIRVVFEKPPPSVSEMNMEERRGLSEKKIHEIRHFSSFIKERVGEVNKVLDIGSGLGYLDERLLSEGFSVVGIEGNQKYHESAIKRFEDQAGKRRINRCKSRQEMNPNISENPRESFNEFKLNTRNMKHIHLMVDSSETVSKKLEQCITGIPVSLVGLHACGDLTPDLIKQFLKIKHIRNLVLVSCCYHKMKSNFPLSQKLKTAADETGFTLFSGQLLRLAAQEPVSRWLRMSPGEHEMHARNVVFRSILEIFSKQRGLELKKKRRKATKDDDVKTFHSYLSSLEAAYELSLEVEDKEILLEIYNSKLHLFNLVENLTGLQFILQNILENLVIADRVQFLQEQSSLTDEFGVKTTVYSLFNDLISPRNKVILAEKFVR